MRRAPGVFALALALLMVLSLSPARAKDSPPAHSRAGGATLQEWAVRWGRWIFGDGSNPALNPVCGELVGDTYFLNAPLDSGIELDCEIPRGTMLVGSPGGYVYWNEPDEDMVAGAEADVAAFVSEPRVAVDGRDLETTLVSTGAFDLALEPGNFIQFFDPSLEGDHTRAAVAGYFVRILPLTPGAHEIIISVKYEGLLYDMTLHVTV